VSDFVLTPLTTSAGADEHPRSPDGQSIVFESSRDGNREIYRMNADGSQQMNLTNHPGDDHGPEWARCF
jgi:TolB protein